MWSPDGKWIAFFAYRDGGYDIWAIAPDGANQHKLTWGAFDDREPAWSHDGTRVAFSSDRGNPLGSDYNIWILDVGHRRPPAAHERPGRRLHADLVGQTTPTSRSPRHARRALGVGGQRGRRSPNGKVSTADRPGGRAILGTRRPDRLPRLLAARTRAGSKSAATPLTGTENVFPFRASWASATEFFYVSDGKIRKRTFGAAVQPTCRFHGDAGSDAGRNRIYAPNPRLHVRRSSQVLGVVRPVISPDAKQVAFAAVGDIYVMPVGGKPLNITKDSALDTDPAWSPDGTQLVYSSDKNSEHAAALDPRHANGTEPAGHAPDDATAGRNMVARWQAHRRSSTWTACGASRRCRCST